MLLNYNGKEKKHRTRSETQVIQQPANNRSVITTQDIPLESAMTRRQALQAGHEDYNEIDMLFDLELEEEQMRIAARRLAANRKLEDVEYWRKRSGWYDDDESMREYNSGVYNSYYSIDDDQISGSSSSSAEGGFGIDAELLKTAGQICGALVGIVVLVMLIRAITRGSARRKKGDAAASSSTRNKRGRRRSSSRTRSKSRTRSRSSRRAKEGSGGATDENYELMDDNKTPRPRSRSKARSRSKSRSRPSSRREEMLV